MLEIILGLEDVLSLLPRAFVTGGVGFPNAKDCVLGAPFNGLMMEG